MADLLRPNDLKQISIDAEMEKMDEERKLKTKKEEGQLELREAFTQADASTTRRFRAPRTRKRPSSTAMGSSSRPILQVQEA
mgnify:CR=1 FL=1